jgi:hypothetical protein
VNLRRQQRSQQATDLHMVVVRGVGKTHIRMQASAMLSGKTRHATTLVNRGGVRTGETNSAATSTPSKRNRNMSHKKER